MGYALDTFVRTSRKLSYVGYDHAQGAIASLPAGTFVVFRPRQDDLDAAWFGGRLPVAFLGANEQTFSDTAALDADLQSYAGWLAYRGIEPAAVMYEEEWYPRATHTPEIQAWAIFQGLDAVGVRNVVRDRLSIIYSRIKAQWPAAYTVAVEPVWHDSLLFGPDFYAPVPASVEILGVDAYLWAHGNPQFGTPPLTDQADQVMLNKFYDEVGRFVEEAARVGAGRSVMVVAQAFRNINPADQWGKAPTSIQLDWFYRCAQLYPAVAALEFFCATSLRNVLGLSDLPAQQAMATDIVAYNAGLP